MLRISSFVKTGTGRGHSGSMLQKKRTQEMAQEKEDPPWRATESRKTKFLPYEKAHLQ